jgi:hypothetical protein
MTWGLVETYGEGVRDALRFARERPDGLDGLGDRAVAAPLFDHAASRSRRHQLLECSFGPILDIDQLASLP